MNIVYGHYIYCICEICETIKISNNIFAKIRSAIFNDRFYMAYDRLCWQLPCDGLVCIQTTSLATSSKRSITFVI